MKKIGIINSEISRIVSELGHTDKIVICDSGLPIPANVKRIDLALKPGVPGFLETLETVLSELCVEQAYAACELEQKSPELKQSLARMLGPTPLTLISHAELKELTKEARAVIRTGEFTPYANVILQAGVIF